MWWTLFLLCPMLVLLFIRNNEYLRIYFNERLYKYGIQIGDHIYTSVCDVHSEFRYFDLVLLNKEGDHLNVFRLLNREKFKIPLTYCPLGHKLECDVDHIYFDGSPFKLKNGELILYKIKKARFGTSKEELKRSNNWPI